MDSSVDRRFYVCVTLPDMERTLGLYQGVLELEPSENLRNEKCTGAVLEQPRRKSCDFASPSRVTNADNVPVTDVLTCVHPTTATAEGRLGRSTTEVTRGWHSTSSTGPHPPQTHCPRDNVDTIYSPDTAQLPTGGTLRMLTFIHPGGTALELVGHSQTSPGEPHA